MFFSDDTKESSNIVLCGDVCPLGMKCAYSEYGVTEQLYLECVPQCPPSTATSTTTDSSTDWWEMVPKGCWSDPYQEEMWGNKYHQFA